ncbi:DUF986 domain-containing protein [Sporolactobacillus sp. THM7-4]|nr:DUF986 domain-containing protein [Sporolactobacillus sp. THM7-4]
MSFTAVVLIILMTGMLGYALYDRFIIPFRKGKNILSIKLRKHNYTDEIIFAGLIIILFISNKVRGGDGLTSILLFFLTIIFLYYVFIRSPKAYFKQSGFYYGFFYTDYDRVKNMRLSEDGVLVIDTDRRRMLLYARKIEDLEKILNVFLEH